MSARIIASGQWQEDERVDVTMTEAAAEAKSAPVPPPQWHIGQIVDVSPRTWIGYVLLRIFDIKKCFEAKEATKKTLVHTFPGKVF